MAWLRRIARCHPLLCFFALAFFISWTLWSPLAFNKQRDSSASWQYLHLLGGLGPACAALITARLYGGDLELRKLTNRMLAWRVSPVWHLVAWFSPFVLFALAVLVVRLASGQNWQPDTFGRSAEYPHVPRLAYWAASLVFYGWGEETGWRGFALPHLQTRYSALTSTLLLSVMWACWHLPLFLIAPGFSRMNAPDVMGWHLSLVTAAILFTWLFNSTRGSVLIAAVFHGTMDIAFVSPGPPSVATVLGAFITVWGVAVVFLTGRSDLHGAARSLDEVES